VQRKSLVSRNRNWNTHFHLFTPPKAYLTGSFDFDSQDLKYCFDFLVGHHIFLIGSHSPFPAFIPFSSISYVWQLCTAKKHRQPTWYERIYVFNSPTIPLLTCRRAKHPDNTKQFHFPFRKHENFHARSLENFFTHHTATLGQIEPLSRLGVDR